jgi:hypothetical protein
VSQLWRKLVGDWHLLKSHEEYETMLERAERMPECFGMSAAFMGEAAGALRGADRVRLRGPAGGHAERAFRGQKYGPS